MLLAQGPHEKPGRKTMCVLLKEEGKKKKGRRKTRFLFLFHAQVNGGRNGKWIQSSSRACSLLCSEMVLRDVFLLPRKLPVTFGRPAGDSEDDTDELMCGNTGCLEEREGREEITESSRVISQVWELKACHLDRPATGQLTATPEASPTFQKHSGADHKAHPQFQPEQTPMSCNKTKPNPSPAQSHRPLCSLLMPEPILSHQP